MAFKSPGGKLVISFVSRFLLAARARESNKTDSWLQSRNHWIVRKRRTMMVMGKKVSAALSANTCGSGKICNRDPACRHHVITYSLISILCESKMPLGNVLREL